MINKDNRRRLEMQHKVDYNEGWNLSYQYSSILIDNITDEDLYNLCCVNHSQFMNELKRKGINKEKNYTQVWDTMLNTVYDKKNKNENIKKAAIRLLHQTNQQRIYKYHLKSN